jgi:hypothetical protein
MCDMGWRERDYARFNEDERRHFFGTSAADAPRAYAPSGVRFTRGAGAAVLVSATLFALGQLPRQHPLVPALHFKISIPGHATRADAGGPTLPKPRPIVLPTHVPARGNLIVSASIRGYTGRLVTLEARWNRAQWRTVGVRRLGANGKVHIPVRLTHRGVLRLRVTYPKGQSAVGRTFVR